MSKTAPGLMVPLMIRLIMVGRYLRTAAGPPNMCTSAANMRLISRETPCGTPTKDRCPPGRTQPSAWLKASSLPTASTTPSAPRPPVSSLMRATPSSPRSSTMSVAPNSRASACRSAWRDIAMMRDAPSWRAPMIAPRPTAPSPTMTIVVPGPAPASSAANQPVPSTSEAARSEGSCSRVGVPGVFTSVPSARAMRAYSAWVPPARMPTKGSPWAAAVAQREG